jgi:hypothetical protein
MDKKNYLDKFNIDLDQFLTDENELGQKFINCINDGNDKQGHPISKMLLVTFAMTKILAYVATKSSFPIDFVIDCLKKDYDDINRNQKNESL